MKYKFDGSIDGIFSCILRCFVNRENPVEITTDPIQTSFNDGFCDVKTDYVNNQRVINAFYKYCGYWSMRDLKYAFRSGDKNKNTVIFNYLKRTFEYRKNIFKKDISSVIIYSTKPVGKIVGEFSFKKIHKNAK